MRIDVDLPAGEIARELAALHQRLRTPGDRLHGLPRLPSAWPHLRWHYREADGEFYVYVEDLAAGQLAGYTVFNRLIELDRLADRYLRAPHSRFGAAWQQRGIASAVYRWALQSGQCLISGRRQSAGAHRLWERLAGSFDAGYVQLRGRSLRWLGEAPHASLVADFDTRRVLLGDGWTRGRFFACTGCDVAQEEAAGATQG